MRGGLAMMVAGINSLVATFLVAVWAVDGNLFEGVLPAKVGGGIVCVVAFLIVGTLHVVVPYVFDKHWPQPPELDQKKCKKKDD